MKKLSLLLAICVPILLSAQTRQVTGKVTDDNNAPLPGVSIVVKGASGGAQTDKDGAFTISLPGTGTVQLVFSHAGFQAVTLGTDGSKPVSLRLVKNDNSLEDVVVVGYSSVKRRDLTASVSSVSAKDLKNTPLNSAAEALAGRLAGVTVNVSEGAPGADVDVYVRGRGSITQSGAPLYVVDGIQIENALSVLSPQDIESIVVLKDAASTAIYGARGSNGVFLITTKGGKNTGGKTTVTYNGFAGITQLGKELDMMDPYNFVLYWYERAKYSENASDTAEAAIYINRMSNYDTIASTYKNYPTAMDWQKKVMGRNAFQQTNNISVSGGTATTQFNLSLTANKQEGLISNSALDRKLISFRFDHKATEKLKVGFNARYNVQKITGAGTSDAGGAGSNRLRQYTRYRPLLLPGQPDDYYDVNLDVAQNPGNGLNLVNPLQLINNEYRLRTVTAYNFNGYLNYSFAKNFSFRSTFGYDVNKTESDAYDDTLTANARANSRLPILTISNNDRYTINNSNVVTYSNHSLFNSKHSVDVLVGQEIYQTDTKTNSLQVNYFPVGIKPEQAMANLGLAAPPAGLQQPKPASADVVTRQLSLFSSIKYNFEQKYLLTLNFRADGSSLFGADYSSPIAPTDPTNRKWGYFPSAAVAWHISQESFMQNMSFLSDAKIRVSYGAAGNNRLNAYGYTTGYSPPSNAGYGLSDVLNYTLTLPSRLGNPVITWENLLSKNLGFDLAFLNNRISLTVDLYSNLTKNLLIENKIAPTSGYTTQYQNVGSMRNNGLEIQLGATVLQKRDFNWNANFNIAFNQNKIMSLGSQTKFTANSGWFSTTANPDDYLVRVGDPIGSMYGLKTDGFYKPSDFDVTPYVDATNNAKYPTLLYQYKLNGKVPDATSVLVSAVAPGQEKFVDMNNDGRITLDSDRTVIGHALPKFTGGFNQQFTYKNWDLNVFVNFSYGNQIFNANKLEFGNAYGLDQNMLAINNGRWKYIDATGNLVQKQLANPVSGQPPIVIGIAPDALTAVNAGATIWQPSQSVNGFALTSYAVEDGSYLRVNNVTLGYTIPKQWTQRAKIASFRIYATASNLLTLTSYSGYDPDVSTRRSSPLTPGVDYAAYPRGRTYVFGVNISL